MHYNNPNRVAGKVDSSGVLISMTSELRDQDAGFWPIGIKTQKIRVPPGKEAYGLKGEYTFPAGTDITVFAAALHQHLIGRRIWSALYPAAGGGRAYNAKGQDVLGHNDFWDFNYQAFWPTSANVKAGDKVVTTCIWTNTVAMGTQYGNTDAAAGKEVRGCEATVCEMCINFMAYYPVTKGKTKRNGYGQPAVVCKTPAECDALN